MLSRGMASDIHSGIAAVHDLSFSEGIGVGETMQWQAPEEELNAYEAFSRYTRWKSV